MVFGVAIDHVMGNWIALGLSILHPLALRINITLRHSSESTGGIEEELA